MIWQGLVFHRMMHFALSSLGEIVNWMQMPSCLDDMLAAARSFGSNNVQSHINPSLFAPYGKFLLRSLENKDMAPSEGSASEVVCSMTAHASSCSAARSCILLFIAFRAHSPQGRQHSNMFYNAPWAAVSCDRARKAMLFLLALLSCAPILLQDIGCNTVAPHNGCSRVTRC